MSDYFTKVKDVVRGPFPETMIRQKIIENRLHLTDLCSLDGENFSPIGETLNIKNKNKDDKRTAPTQKTVCIGDITTAKIWSNEASQIIERVDLFDTLFQMLYNPIKSFSQLLHFSQDMYCKKMVTTFYFISMCVATFWGIFAFCFLNFSYFSFIIVFIFILINGLLKKAHTKRMIIFNTIPQYDPWILMLERTACYYILMWVMLFFTIAALLSPYGVIGEFMSLFISLLLFCYLAYQIYEILQFNYIDLIHYNPKVDT